MFGASSVRRSAWFMEGDFKKQQPRAYKVGPCIAPVHSAARHSPTVPCRRHKGQKFDTARWGAKRPLVDHFHRLHRHHFHHLKGGFRGRFVPAQQARGCFNRASRRCTQGTSRPSWSQMPPFPLEKKPQSRTQGTKRLELCLRACMARGQCPV